MFIEFDGYFINLAKVEGINEASEFPDTDIWDIFIYLDDVEADPIKLISGLKGLPHAKAFRHALIRHACTTGLAVDEDLERIYQETMPADRS